MAAFRLHSSRAAELEQDLNDKFVSRCIQRRTFQPRYERILVRFRHLRRGRAGSFLTTTTCDEIDGVRRCLLLASSAYIYNP